ncbi:hypothetical protein Tsubulata_003276 [Turnera subulata]|uniref:AB hydrolase-1 domain-containing protein n=1 Tax=Turnera subulata TaxID=218843 RepID=A0A9Q0J4H1_9ROSI|nr:hypothetical protein Tsubulata_003276 [Turnera subulata]
MACHGAWCWYKVAALLKSAGHKVTALDLGASGLNPKQVQDLHSISDYFEPLTEFMMSLGPADQRVILVGHSMGGIGLSFAMERFPERVAAAYARRVDFMDTKYIHQNGADNPPTALLFGPNIMATKLYQLCSAEAIPPAEPCCFYSILNQDLELGISLLRPVPCFSDAAVQEKAVFTKERYGSVARVYIVCDQDNVIKEDLQRWMIENNPPNEVKLISGSDHMVMLCKPHELCSYLQEIAGKYS